MDVPIKFMGGPLNGLTGTTSALHRFKLLFDEDARRIYYYRRDHELTYLYSPHVSEVLTPEYDDAWQKFGKAHDGVRMVLTPPPSEEKTK